MTMNMNPIPQILSFALQLLISEVTCDFSCICNYNVEKPVYGQLSSGSDAIGYLYEFDCKPEGKQTGDSHWISIQYERQYGYLESDPNTMKQVCPGAPPDTDTVTTTTAITTTTTITTKTTTTKPTTTSATTEPKTTRTATTSATSQSTTTSITTTPKPTTTRPTTTSTTTRPKTTRPTTASTTTTTPTTASTTTTRPTATGPTTTSTVTAGCGTFLQNVHSNEPGVLFTITASSNTCYELVTFPKHGWRVAENHCTANGGNLVHIPNRQVQDGINSFVHSHGGQEIWIGLNDLSIEETFAWVSGDPVTMTNWKDDRFADFGHNTDDCVVMTDQSHNATWDDRTCTQLHGFVCEYVTVMYGCPHTTHNTGDLERGTLFSVDNHCYELVPTTHSWRMAENHCVNKGGHLARIDNMRQQNGVHQVVKGSGLGNVWIGLHDHDIEGHYFWITGSVASYTNFSPVQTGLLNNKDCVSIDGSTGLWNDEFCTTSHPYLCEIESDSATARPTTGYPVWLYTTQHTTYFTDGNTQLCPARVQSMSAQYGTPLAQHDSSCYDIITDAVTWSYGETLCNQNGGHLVDILSDDEQNFITSFVTRHGSTDVWIGINDIHSEGTQVWTSGKPVTYTHWQSGYVGNVDTPGNEDCGLMRGYLNGAWDDVPCGQTYSGIALQKHQVLCEYSIIGAGHTPNLIG